MEAYKLMHQIGKFHFSNIKANIKPQGLKNTTPRIGRKNPQS